MFRAALLGSLSFGGYSYYQQQQQQQQTSTPSSNFFSSAWCKYVKPPFDIQAIGQDLYKMLEDNPEMGPTLVRLSWHNSGAFDKSKPDEGCANSASMRFEPEKNYGANAGLGKARDFLEPLKKKYPEISYADLWTLSACIAIRQMNGPEVPWRWGRKDAKGSKDCSPDGRLPDAAKGVDHIREVFNRMGYNDQEMVALIGGGHGIGKSHKENTGFETKPWKHDFLIFDNGYFTALLGEKWKVDKKHKDPKQFNDENTGLLIMFPSDMAFLDDKNFKKYCEQYAEDNDKFNKDFVKTFQKLCEFGVEKKLNECDSFNPPEDE